MSSVEFQRGYRDGYRSAAAFHGRGAAEALGRIAVATAELREMIAASGGRPPALLLQYLADVDANTQGGEEPEGL